MALDSGPCGLVRETGPLAGLSQFTIRCYNKYMTTVQRKEKVLRLEAQVKSMKVSLERRPDFSVDDRIWAKVRPVVKSTRRTLFKELYGKK